MEVRRSTRVLARLNVLITSAAGSHNALTAVVNRNGALILCPVAYPVDTALQVRNMATGQSADSRVVWSGGPDNSGLFKLGIQLNEDRPEFWGVEYAPPPPEPPTQ
jgi:hypothetical protein